MTKAPAKEQEPAGGDREAGGHLSTALVKAAAISILPWTLGSLLSPLGEPHLVLLALPLVALALLIVNVRRGLALKRPWIAWVFVAPLVIASGTRFLVLPFFSELTTGGTDAETAGASLERVFLFLGAIKLFFYASTAGLLAYSLLGLIVGASRGRKKTSNPAGSS